MQDSKFGRMLKIFSSNLPFRETTKKQFLLAHNWDCLSNWTGYKHNSRLQHHPQVGVIINLLDDVKLKLIL